MYLPEHKRYIDEIRELDFFTPKVLVLGNQENHLDISEDELLGTRYYESLDPDGGDIKGTLENYRPYFSSVDGDCWVKYGSVFNMGTIEHIWDVHSSFCRVADLIKIGGYYIHHGPSGGYEHHGIHVTSDVAIKTFFSLQNGFKLIYSKYCLQTGEEIDQVLRGQGNQIFWMVAKKFYEVDEYKRPQQVFENGEPMRFELK